MKVVVVASGDIGTGDARLLDDADVVIAADGGANALERLGVPTDVLVGDLDSADADVVERLGAGGTRIERHPVDKESSDTELALAAAVEAGATEIVLLGAIGGDRLDHALANVLLLAEAALADRDLRLVHAGASVRAIRGPDRRALSGPIGHLVTLLPVGGDARGVTTAGLRWQLDGATLAMGASRGLSNEIVATPAWVSLDAGGLLIIESPHRKEPSP